MSNYVNPLDAPDFKTHEEVLNFIANDVEVLVNPTRIHNAIKFRELEALKISGRNRYTRRSILTWLETKLNVNIDWESAELAAKRDRAAVKIAETTAALEMLS